MKPTKRSAKITKQSFERWIVCGLVVYGGDITCSGTCVIGLSIGEFSSLYVGDCNLYPL